MSTAETRQSLGVATVAGVLAWLLAYVATYAIVAPQIRESTLGRIIEALDAGPATYELVGWVFYNAHFVNTVVRDIPVVGTQTTTFVGGDGGFTAILYVLPAGILFATGVALARRAGAADAAEGVRAAIAMVPAYAVLSALGVFLFEYRAAGAGAGPDMVTGIVLAGVIYPVVCAAAGGVVGGET